MAHLFFNCEWADRFWFLEGLGLRWKWPEDTSGERLIEAILDANEAANLMRGRSDELVVRAWLLLEELWRHRNNKVFDDRAMEFERSLIRVRGGVRDHMEISVFPGDGVSPPETLRP